MNSLVVGAGEVGKSLAKVLECQVRDKNDNVEGIFDIIHICFPYSKIFENEVRKYQNIYKPQYTIVHSTVPIGTCSKLEVYHSPVRGIHPYMVKSMKTFITYLAPHNEDIKEYLKSKGMKIVTKKDAKYTEAGKLFSTTYYFLCILYEKIVYDFCEKNNLDFDTVYREFNETYNEGYMLMGKEHVRRPVLRHIKGKVGGHCLIPNAEILSEKHNLELAKILLNMNKSL